MSKNYFIKDIFLFSITYNISIVRTGDATLNSAVGWGWLEEVKQNRIRAEKLFHIIVYW